MHTFSQSNISPTPKVIAWEVTRRCPLNCKHCRAAAQNCHYPDELSTTECKQVIDSIAAFTKPILIMTGGEPMLREDIYELAAYASKKGIYVVMAPCGQLLNESSCQKLIASGVKAICLSVDAPNAEAHDRFRGREGTFEAVMEGVKAAREAGLKFQINSTVSRLNMDQLVEMKDFVIGLGAATWDLFFLVPTGRGAGLKGLELSADRHEEVLHWVYEQAQNSPIRIKTTCAPHYARIQQQNAPKGGRPSGHGGMSGGCLAGDGFVFISHRGILQPCGFLEVACGDLRGTSYDFRKSYLESPQFQALRDIGKYGGKCGPCEYVNSCGGCRARGYAQTGNFLSEEPFCNWQSGGKIS